MYTVRVLNNISQVGLERFPTDEFQITQDAQDPDAILLRSHKMHGMELPTRLKAVARAGAGVNNIPVDACTERGIVVFNTPGANANSVKELVIAGLLLSSRHIVDGIAFARSLKDGGADVTKAIEKQKSLFAGPEIMGKTLGVVGLGAIGVLVANAADALGMEVVGYDPFISVESAWGLSRNVRRAEQLEDLVAQSDYLTLHLPLNENTKNLINSGVLRNAKPNVRILNFARGGLVAAEDLLKALKSDKVASYVTDFPAKEMLGEDKVIPIPHLGASTPEAEENCAVMAVDQLIDFLISGNVKNSVNFPECAMPCAGDSRIVIANRNIPNMVGQITTILAQDSINISDMLNRHQDQYAYNIIDIEGTVSNATFDKLKAIEGVTMARLIGGQ